MADRLGSRAKNKVPWGVVILSIIAGLVLLYPILLIKGLSLQEISIDVRMTAGISLMILPPILVVIFRLIDILNFARR